MKMNVVLELFATWMLRAPIIWEVSTVLVMKVLLVMVRIVKVRLNLYSVISLSITFSYEHLG
jgi:hypothetical protein